MPTALAANWVVGNGRGIRHTNLWQVHQKLAGVCRVLRGGAAWNDDPRHLRSANRDRHEPENRDADIGFRCVRRPRRQP